MTAARPRPPGACGPPPAGRTAAPRLALTGWVRPRPRRSAGPIASRLRPMPPRRALARPAGPRWGWGYPDQAVAPAAGGRGRLPARLPPVLGPAGRAD